MLPPSTRRTHGRRSRRRPLALAAAFGLSFSALAACSLIPLDDLSRGSPDAGPDAGTAHGGGGSSTSGGAGGVGVGGTGAGAGGGPCGANDPFNATVTELYVTPGPAFAPRLSADELTLYLHTIDGFEFDGGPGNTDILVAHRGGRDVPFDLAQKIAFDTQTYSEQQPALTADGLELYYSSDQQGSADIWRASRDTDAESFGGFMVVLAMTGSDTQPFISADGSELWFASSEAAACAYCMDLYVAQRQGSLFSPPVKGKVNDPASFNGLPVLSADKLTLFFTRAPASDLEVGQFDIYMSTRATPTDDFEVVSRVDALSTNSREAPGWLSPDNCRLYFEREAKLFVASRM